MSLIKLDQSFIKKHFSVSNPALTAQFMWLEEQHEMNLLDIYLCRLTGIFISDSIFISIP